MSATPSADRNMLCGVVALRRNLITPGQLAEAMGAWAERREAPLADVLRQRGWLAEETYRELVSEVESELAGASQVILDTVGPSGGGAIPPLPPEGARYGRKREYARGGLGVVFAAVDRELGREVALKEIQDRHADSAGSRRRFVREAEVTGNLEHPGIVPVYGLGVYPDGRPYYAMRFIRGESMQQAIKRYHAEPSEMELRRLLGRFVAVCNAVAYAHSRGVVHRDLKPNNVMLGEYGETLVVDYGETLVVDWGLAKVVGSPGADDGLGRHAGGAVSDAGGTIAFMPPEQARGQWSEVGPAADVFALGATLYTLLTGRVVNASLEEAKRGEVKLARRVNVAVPRALEAVCAKAMASSPEGRYATATELAAEVERWLADEPVAAYREPWRVRARRWARRHGKVVTGGVVLLAATVMGLGLGLWAVELERRNTEQQRDRAGRAEAEATEKRTQAEKNLLRAEKAERDAKANLVRAQKNLKLAKKAIDETFGVAKDHPQMQAVKNREVRQLLLAKAQPFYADFLREEGRDPEVAWEAARYRFYWAYVETHIGSRKAALRAYLEALELLESVLDKDTRNVDLLHSLLSNCISVGLAHNALGDYREAYKFLIRAREVQQRIERLARERKTFRLRELEDAAFLEVNLGEVLGNLGKDAEARRAFAKSVELWVRVVEAAPAVPRYKVHLSASRYHLAFALGRNGQASEAVAAFLQGCEELHRLVRDHPDIPDFRFNLARHYRGLAIHLPWTRREEARRALQRAGDLSAGLVAEYPGEKDYLLEFGQLALDSGNRAKWGRRPAEAERAYLTARDTFLRLSRIDPLAPLYFRNAATAENNLGILLREQRRYPAALQALESGRDRFLSLIKSHPQRAQYRHDLARTYGNIADLWSQSGDHRKALEAIESKKAVFAELCRIDPNDPEAPFYLAWAYQSTNWPLRSLGLTDRLPKELASSVEHFSAAIQLLDRHPRSKQSGTRQHSLLLNALEYRVRALVDLERHGDALPDLDRLVSLEAPERRGPARMARAVSLLKTGKHDLAAAEASDLAATAKSGHTVVSLARILSLSAAAVRQDDSRPLPLRERLAESRAQGAVALLVRAAKLGEFRWSARVLDTDPDLAFLHGRPDYRAFCASLNAK